jgi:hypothetical protein
VDQLVETVGVECCCTLAHGSLAIKRPSAHVRAAFAVAPR